MPYRPRRRELFITVNPWMLVGSIAVGLWLGFMAILITCALIYKIYEEQQIRQVNSAFGRWAKSSKTLPHAPRLMRARRCLSSSNRTKPNFNANKPKPGPKRQKKSA